MFFKKIDFRTGAVMTNVVGGWGSLKLYKGTIEYWNKIDFNASSSVRDAGFSSSGFSLKTDTSGSYGKYAYAAVAECNEVKMYKSMEFPENGQLRFNYKSKLTSAYSFLQVSYYSSRENPPVLWWSQDTNDTWKKGTLEVGAGKKNMMFYFKQHEWKCMDEAETVCIDNVEWGPFYKEGYAPQGTYISEIFKTRGSTEYRLGWYADLPDGTSCDVFVRTSANNTTWTDWRHVNICTQNVAPIYNFLQIKVVLSTTNDQVTPELFFIALTTHDNPAFTDPGRPWKAIRAKQFLEVRDAVNYFMPNYDKSIVEWTNPIVGTQRTVPRDVDYYDVIGAINEMLLCEDGSIWLGNDIEGKSINVDDVLGLQDKIDEIYHMPPVEPQMRTSPVIPYIGLKDPSYIKASARYDSGYDEYGMMVEWGAAVPNDSFVTHATWWPSTSVDAAYYEAWWSFDNGRTYTLGSFHVDPTEDGYHEAFYATNSTIVSSAVVRFKLIVVDRNCNITASNYSVDNDGVAELDHYRLHYAIGSSSNSSNTNSLRWSNIGVTKATGELQNVSFTRDSKVTYSNLSISPFRLAEDVMKVSRLSCRFKITSGFDDKQWELLYYNPNNKTWNATGVKQIITEFNTPYTFTKSFSSPVPVRYVAIRPVLSGTKFGGRVKTGINKILQTGVSGVTMVFSRISGNGFLPTNTTTTSGLLTSGSWSQVGFDPNTIYRVTPMARDWAFNPEYIDFSTETKNKTSLDFNATATTSNPVIPPSPSDYNPDHCVLDRVDISYNYDEESVGKVLRYWHRASTYGTYFYRVKAYDKRGYGTNWVITDGDYYCGCYSHCSSYTAPAPCEYTCDYCGNCSYTEPVCPCNVHCCVVYKSCPCDCDFHIPTIPAAQ